MRIRQYTEFLLYRLHAELRAEALRGYLGFLWWIVEPLALMLAFYVVFGIVMQTGKENYVAFLLSGLVFWKWFDSSVRGGSMAIMAYGNLIQQVYLPKHLFPLLVVLVNTVKFLIVLGLLLIFLLLYGISPGWNWLGLLPLIMVQFALGVGLAGVFAALVPFVPDLRVAIDNGMLLLMFLSGIFFDLSSVPEGVAQYLRLNPMAGLIENYRGVLLEGQWPDMVLVAVLGAVAFAFVLLAGFLLHRFDRVYPKVVVV